MLNLIKDLNKENESMKIQLKELEEKANLNRSVLANSSINLNKNYDTFANCVKTRKKTFQVVIKSKEDVSLLNMKKEVVKIC